MTAHAAGSIASFAAAARNMSGAGLPCSISSPATLTANASASPARRSVRSSRARGEEDATATVTPRSRNSATVDERVVERPQLAVDQREQRGRVVLPEGVRLREPVDPLREVAVHARIGQPDQARVLLVADRVSVRRERPLPREPRERLGVDEGAVAVEDDGLDRHGRPRMMAGPQPPAGRPGSVAVEGQRLGRERRVAEDQVRGLLGNHDHRRVDVRVRDEREHRRVDDAQPLDAVHPHRRRIDDGHVVRAHARGARRVQRGLGVAPTQSRICSSVATRRAG